MKRTMRNQLGQTLETRSNRSETMMKTSDSQVVYVRQDNSATVTCPHCGVRYKVNAGKVTTCGRRCKLRCKCGHRCSVFFEFRENPRRELYVDGYYRPIREVYIRGAARTGPTSESLVLVLVQNISRTGIGFVVATGHELKVGDRLEIMFTLDDPEQSRVEREGVVRRLAEDNYLGCEFTDFGHVDRATGFYVMT
ncbi:MAG: PilZ domain-containing protein [Deltaproteobacteria bacterium]|nr:PilZ domain-containing protein [Deltaproteobacteria bacterium]